MVGVFCQSYHHVTNPIGLSPRLQTGRRLVLARPGKSVALGASLGTFNGTALPLVPQSGWGE